MNATNYEVALDPYLEDLSMDQLKALVKKVSWNSGFGCFSRTGFEEIIWPKIQDQAEWIIFMDIDDLHMHNSQFDSYEPVNAMICEALSITREGDVKAGLLQSGDEILVVILKDKRRKTDPEGLVGRLVAKFGEHGMSATFAIVPVISPDLMTNLEPAIEKVKKIKAKRGSLR